MNNYVAYNCLLSFIMCNDSVTYRKTLYKKRPELRGVIALWVATFFRKKSLNVFSVGQGNHFEGYLFFLIATLDGSNGEGISF